MKFRLGVDWAERLCYLTKHDFQESILICALQFSTLFEWYSQGTGNCKYVFKRV